MHLQNLILPGRGTNNTFDLEVSDDTGKIKEIQQHDRSTSNSKLPPVSRVIPTLCHPHIHLDKPFLLNSHNHGQDLPDYSDLALEKGSFSEALSRTSKAKERYTPEDLLHRGGQLIAESFQAGVTSMRAFVEVDSTTKHKCVDAGIQLKHRYADKCHVQLCIFAQDPVFNKDKNGPSNRKLVEEALEKYAAEIEVLGSTPYVEGSVDGQKSNIEWAIQNAIRYSLHLDFHLDYNLDEGSESMVWHVVEILKRENWNEANEGKDRTIVLGHCSRMTLFTNEQMFKLATEIHDANLPISFVGLPTSDLFMMGQPEPNTAAFSRPRGTLQVLDLINHFNLNACISINNVGNTFTPWGSVDPLRLASLGVGVYQAGTPRDAEMLFECISARAQDAIGLSHMVVRSIEEGAHALFMVVSNDDNIHINGQDTGVPARKRLSVADMVWDPPELRQRRVIGKVNLGS